VADARPLWERQPWDTDASFAKFHAYYLAQDAPRSLNEAYRRYRLQQGSRRVASDGPIYAPGSWQQWYRGQNTKGEVKPGAVGWDERARAWDNHQAQLDRERWEARRKRIREADFAAGERLRALADKILDETPQFLKTTRRIVRGTGGQPDREIITVGIDIHAMARALKLASDLQNQAAGTVPPPQEVVHSGTLTVRDESVIQVTPHMAQAAQAALRAALDAQAQEADDATDDSDPDYSGDIDDGD